MAGFRLQRVIEGWELWRGETGMAWLRLACWLSSLISVGSSASGPRWVRMSALTTPRVGSYELCVVRVTGS